MPAEVCAWCGEEAVYQRPYLVRPRSLHKRTVYACAVHARQLLKIAHGYSLRRIDGAGITAEEAEAVFNRPLARPHGHHGRSAIF